MPEKADSYLHRVGRAGRFGTKGLSISFVSSPDDEDILKQIEQRFEVALPYVHPAHTYILRTNYVTVSSLRMVSTPPPTWTTEFLDWQSVQLGASDGGHGFFSNFESPVSNDATLYPSGLSASHRKNAAWRRGGSGWLSNGYL
jgi:hypothetical protein